MCLSLCLDVCLRLSPPHLHFPVILTLLITCAAEEAPAKCLLVVMLSKLGESLTVYVCVCGVCVCVCVCVSISVCLNDCVCVQCAISLTVLTVIHRLYHCLRLPQCYYTSLRYLPSHCISCSVRVCTCMWKQTRLYYLFFTICLVFVTMLRQEAQLSLPASFCSASFFSHVSVCLRRLLSVCLLCCSGGVDEA